LIEIFNKYNLKGTFNLNSSFLGLQGGREVNGKFLNNSKVFASEVKETYLGHEVAVHTLTHPNLTCEAEETVVYQVEEDRKRLSGLVGYEVKGMAYPCGGVNNDDRTAAILERSTGVEYARTINSTLGFEPPKNPYRWHPSVYARDGAKTFELAEKFLSLEADTPQIFFVWGHAHEFDILDDMNWERVDELCKMLSNRNDVLYGTNKQALECLKNLKN
jgi:peptidoglycan/xylan/chitin deacetylase (PgdA/CDA1 family)